MKIAIIDNYDSFTYNLSHLLKQLGAKVEVYRNDRFTYDQLDKADKLVLSPGPGIPCEAGQLMEVIDRYAAHKPILGICLGHQALGEYFGAELTNLKDVMHGLSSPAHVIVNDYIFDNLPTTITVGRYHSWVISSHKLPSCLETTSLSDEGHIMSLRHRSLDIRGIQFHPESVLTPEGRAMLANWIEH